MQRVDLLVELDDLVRECRSEALEGAWLDAYLLGAGAWQVCEDLVAATSNRRLAAQSSMATRRSRGATLALDLVWRGDDVRHVVRSSRGPMRDLDTLTSLQVPVITELARRLLDTAQEPLSPRDPLCASLERIERLVQGLPAALRTTPGKVPSSFRVFDQRPSDVVALVDELVERESQPRAYVAVGVRTSGAYLAPLAVAALEARGRFGSPLVSVRPGAHLSRRARASLRHADPASMFLVLDDPPSTGAALRAAMRSLPRRALDEDRVTLLLAVTSDDGSLPPTLDRFSRVTLKWGDWAIHEELSARRVGAELLRAREDLAEVVRIDEAPSPDRSRREHQMRRFDVRVRSFDAEESDLHVEARGVGMGYFGSDSLRSAQLLGGVVPSPITLSHGVVICESTPATGGGAPDADAVASYLARRHDVLATTRDTSTSSHLARSVVEIATNRLLKALGERATLVVGAVLEPPVRRMLRTTQPVVIDGDMDSRHWRKSPQGWLKENYADGAFSSRDLTCYDDYYDLAAACVERDGVFEAMVRSQFDDVTRAPLSDEKWLMYKLVALWDRRRRCAMSSYEYAQRQSDTVIDYLAGVYLGDVTPVRAGPVVALDLDGVLETMSGGYSTPGRLGMMSLRALAAHDFQVVLATGRSLSEVRHRVDRFALSGGVAEYGSVLYVSGAPVRSSLNDVDDDVLERIRGRLAEHQDYEVNKVYQHSVRFAHRTTGGRVPHDDLTRLWRELDIDVPGDVRAIRGDNQIDLIRPGVTKATGLSRLLAVSSPRGPRGEDERRPLRMAVGDSAADLPMLDMAQMAWAPANATSELRRSGVKVVRGQYQEGLAHAVAYLIGHRPGRCAKCRPPVMSRERDIVVRSLSLDEAGPGAMMTRVVRLAAKCRRSVY